MDQGRPLRARAGDRDRRQVGHEQGRAYLGVALALIAGFVPSSSAATEVAVPSGLDVTLFDVILEEDPPVARFRFLAPEIGEDGSSFADIVPDIEYLCTAVIVPSLEAHAWTGETVVVSMSSEAVDFGMSAPDVTQFFQPFQIEEGDCAWLDH
ncbi:MAG: DUF6497 family protein [Paracoccaceae bacterium]